MPWTPSTASSPAVRESSKVADNLARADLKLRVSEYALVVAGVMVGALHGDATSSTTAVLVSLIFGVVAYFAPGFYVKYRQRKRFRKLNNQLGDTILLLSNALKAGTPSPRRWPPSPGRPRRRCPTSSAVRCAR